MRVVIGPVFRYECLTNSRRWRIYAERSLMVAALLAAMVAIAWNGPTVLTGNAAREYSRLGEYYFFAMMGMELAIVILAAPAATAGAICLDRTRGTLEHVLATDLSDAEIVLGKLAARLMPVLELAAASWPVMAISSLLGGIDPFALALAFGIIVAVALLGCALAMALSIWARKPYEVVIGVYFCWAIVLFAYPIWLEIARSRAIAGPPPWLLAANPFYLACTPYIAPNSTGWRDYAGFFGAAAAGSVVLVILAVWRMRPVTVRMRGRAANVARLGLLGRLIRRLPAPSLDGNPVLWREWHRSRPSLWMGILVGLTIGTTTVCCVVGALSLWREGVIPGGGSAAVNAGLWSVVLQVVFGLLMFSAVAPMSLAEERQWGSLEVLLSTPLSARTIVLGKWLGTFRLVPWLALGPGLLALALATGRHPGPATSWPADELSIGERLFGVGLFVATILIHGAAIGSTGLLAATWLRRQASAVAVSVTLSVFVIIAWPLLVFNATGPQLGPSVASALSPLMVAVESCNGLAFRRSGFRDYLWGVTLWDILVAVIAMVLLELTIRTFDHCSGRMPENGTPFRRRFRAPTSGL